MELALVDEICSDLASDGWRVDQSCQYENSPGSPIPAPSCLQSQSVHKVTLLRLHYLSSSRRM